MHIFVDTNVLLEFYSASSESLVELAKIAALVRTQKAVVWIPDQVKREFWKNRAEKIEAIMKVFENVHPIGSIPLLIREDPAFPEFLDLSRRGAEKKALLIQKVRAQITAEETQADLQIRKLFSISSEIDTSGLFGAAFERAMRHTPPGKDEFVGDRLNWLGLLATVPRKSALHVISSDGDFARDDKSEDVMPYLRHEWQKKNGGSVTLWKRLSAFMAAHFPDAENAIAVEHAIAIEQLEASASFTSTHRVVAAFGDMAHMSKTNIDRLANAIVSNTQVYWIAEDEDVKKFLTDFVGLYRSQIDSVVLSKIEGLLKGGMIG